MRSPPGVSKASLQTLGAQGRLPNTPCAASVFSPLRISQVFSGFFVKVRNIPSLFVFRLRQDTSKPFKPKP
ncbi:hypothetical protein DY000_02040459 [Brassica cretica]|uniref:Uncharacterized protein n=1 Tax=Brassica cretica TaxID=69181 RepID=A0ABQ7BDG9_BRACR|nr:hypothetical protein DY000_02040459 [Brassica cretica]